MLPKAGIFELLFSLYLRPNTSCRIIFYTVKISYYLGWEGGGGHAPQCFLRILTSTFSKKQQLFLTLVFFSYIIYIESKRLGSGLSKALIRSVRKHRNLMFRCFCTVIIPDVCRGAVGYKTRNFRKTTESLTYMIFELPNRSFLGGLFIIKRKENGIFMV